MATPFVERVAAAAADLRPVRVGHLFATLVLPAAAVRRPASMRRRGPDAGPLARLSTQLDPPAPVGTAADAVMWIEHALARWFPLPVGLTVAGVFRKT